MPTIEKLSFFCLDSKYASNIFFLGNVNGDKIIFLIPYMYYFLWVGIECQKHTKSQIQSLKKHDKILSFVILVDASKVNNILERGGGR